jgi:hypothetical protein
LGTYSVSETTAKIFTSVFHQMLIRRNAGIIKEISENFLGSFLGCFREHICAVFQFYFFNSIEAFALIEATTFVRMMSWFFFKKNDSNVTPH